MSGGSPSKLANPRLNGLLTNCIVSYPPLFTAAAGGSEILTFAEILDRELGTLGPDRDALHRHAQNSFDPPHV